jgi:hypothetical protein
MGGRWARTKRIETEEGASDAKIPKGREPCLLDITDIVRSGKGAAAKVSPAASSWHGHPKDAHADAERFPRRPDHC